MASKFLKTLALMIPKVKRIYSEIDSLQKENKDLRVILKSVNLYYVAGELIKLKSDEIDSVFLDSLVLNQYETPELELAKKFIIANDIVLDLGCGLGISSMIAAKASGTGRVVAFEADPKMVRIATDNASFNDLNVEVRNKAISKEPGYIDFFLSKNFQYNSKFSGDNMEKIRIEAVSFQNVVDEIKPNVVTCDIEGVEVEIFENIVIPSVRCVIAEMHPALIGKKGIEKCIYDLKNAGLTYQPQFSTGTVIVCLRTV